MPPRDTIKRALDVSPLDVLRIAKRNLMPSKPGTGQAGVGLTADQAALLQLMRADNAASQPPFRASAHWQNVADIFDQAFQAEGLGNPENQSYNFRFSGFAAADPRLHRYVCWMYYQRLKQRDVLGLFSKLRATCQVDRGYAYEMDGRLVSLDLLFSVDDFYNLYELDPRIADSPVIVGELGAGWGRVGNVLCQANPRATYVIFDLPEVLFISQSYLPATLPHSVARSYQAARSLDRIERSTLRDANLWFFGAHHIEKLAPATLDFVVNIGSFQEMPVEYIAKYTAIFSKAAAGGRCFLRQLEFGASHAHRFDEAESFSAYPIPQNWSREYLRPSIMSDQFVEAGYRILEGGVGDER